MRRLTKVAWVVVIVVVALTGLVVVTKSGSAHPADVWYSEATDQFRSRPDAGDLPDLRICPIKSAETGTTDHALIYRETRWTMLRRGFGLGGGVDDAGGYRADGRPVHVDGRNWQRFVLEQD